MRLQATNNLNAALASAVATSSDPQSASRAMPEIARLLAEAQPDWSGRPLPWRIVRPTTTPTVTLSTVAQAAATVFATVNFPSTGRIIGIAATTQEGDQYRALVSASIQQNGGNPMFVQGKGEGFMPLSFFTGFDSRRLEFMEVDIAVGPADVWQVRYTSDVILAAGTQVLTPTMGFLFVPDAQSSNR